MLSASVPPLTNVIPLAKDPTICERDIAGVVRQSYPVRHGQGGRWLAYSGRR
jgi:hypothetical protein